MLIEIHTIQNHSPANLNRDDLGAPKTCYFGGVLRSRISSQCLKRSIRMGDAFRELLGGVRTRRLAKLIADRANDPALEKKAEKVLHECGFLPKKGKTADDDAAGSGDSKMLVYVSLQAIDEMIALLKNGTPSDPKALAAQFAQRIVEKTVAPDMALSGRMLEPDKSGAEIWKKYDATVEAALQAAHAISTHEARPEVDYYVAADDIPGEDAGAGYVDEALFASACFYKYFSIHREQLSKNLEGFGDDVEKLAAHTVGAFLCGAALSNPTGKQNSFAAHNPPDGMLVEIRTANTPISYANAFAAPVQAGNRDVITQSIAQLGQYASDLDAGFGPPERRFWFSPNLRYPLAGPKGEPLANQNCKSLDELVRAVVGAMGHDWDEVQKVKMSENPLEQLR